MNRKYKNLFDLLKHWFTLVVVITIFCGLVYAAVQQDIRQSANDPQIQMAEDAATKLSQGRDPFLLIPNDKVEISNSLAPYLMVFGEGRVAMVSQASLNDQTPNLPPGVFDFAKRFGENRFTWQPRPDVRGAVVLVHYQGINSGFVLAGRSLREVEKREEELFIEVAAAWLVAIFATLVTTILFS